MNAESELIPVALPPRVSWQTFPRTFGAAAPARHQADPFRRLPAAAFGILAESDPERLLARAADELQRTCRADAIRLSELEEEGLVSRVQRGIDWRIGDD